LDLKPCKFQFAGFFYFESLMYNAIHFLSNSDDRICDLIHLVTHSISKLLIAVPFTYLNPNRISCWIVGSR